MKFHVTIDRDEDGAWVVECPAIPGCVSQGKTKEQAIKNIEETIALCLEVRAGRGAAADGRNAPSGSGRLMPALPIISGREAVRTFEKLGCQVARRRCSRIIMTREGEIATLSIPDPKELAGGTLRSGQSRQSQSALRSNGRRLEKTDRFAPSAFGACFVLDPEITMRV
jgi:predicted RNase H-like HicB family nuclease/predicted RNA binding protein YcfA (HicA-like mRNA interferase family)